MNPELLVKRVEVNNIGKTTSFFELMCSAVCFKMSPITGQTKITDGIKDFYGLFNITNKQPSLFECFNLLLCRYGLMCVSSSHKKNVPPGTLILREAGGICRCKGNTLFQICQTYSNGHF